MSESRRFQRIIACAVVGAGLGAATGRAAETPSKPVLTVQKGHTAKITALALSLDGKYLVSAADDHSVKLWEFETGKEVLSVTDWGVDSIQMCPDGKRLVTMGLGEIAIRELPSLMTLMQRDMTELEHDSAIGVAVSPDCRLTAASTRQGGKLFGPPVVMDLETGRVLRKLDMGRLHLEHVQFTHDSKTLIADGRNPGGVPWEGTDGLIKTFDVNTGEKLKEIAYERSIYSGMPQSRIFPIIVAGSKGAAINFEEGKVMGRLEEEDGGVILFTRATSVLRHKPKEGLRTWGLGEGKLVDLQDSVGPHTSYALTPDSMRVVAAGEDKIIRVWDVEQGRLERSFGGRSGRIHAVAFSSDRKLLALASSDSTARVWDLEAGREILALSGHAGPVRAVALSRDGSLLATGGEDKLVKVWSVSQGKELLSLTGHIEYVTRVAFTPDGGRVVSGGFNAYAHLPWNDSPQDTLKVWDAKTGALVWSVPSVMENRGVEDLALSPDGRLVALSRQNHVVEVWDLNSHSKVFSSDLLAKADGYRKVGVKFSPDGSLLAMSASLHTAMADTRTWKSWLVERRPYHKQHKVLPAVGETFSFVEGATRLAGLNSSEIETLELPDLINLTTIYVRSESGISMDVSRDQRHAAVGSQDGTVRVIDLKTGQELFALVSMDKGWAAVAPDGRFDGSGEGLKTLTWSAGSQSFPLEAFSEGYYSPGLIQAALAGADSAPKGQKDLSQGFSLPPKVRVVSPQPGAELTAESLVVKVAAEDQGGGVDEIRLYHNGKAVAGVTRDIKVAEKEGRREQSFQIVMTEGENVFKAVALSRDRIEGLPAEVAVRLKAPSKEAVLHVLAAGINRYKNAALNLSFAKPDALALADFFSASSGRLFKEVRRVELYDEAATKAGLVSALKALAASQPQDVAVLYLAGHGDTLESTWYFAPHELVYPELEEELKAKGLSSAELQELIKGIGAKKVLVLVDACKSGGALLAWAGRGIEERKALARLARASGVYIVAAATDAQAAAEVKDLGHGVFTYALLEALKGAADSNPKDGIVTVGEVLGYVEETLPELTLKYKSQAQYPVKFAGGMDFPVTTVR